MWVDSFSDSNFRKARQTKDKIMSLKYKIICHKTEALWNLIFLSYLVLLRLNRELRSPESEKAIQWDLVKYVRGGKWAIWSRKWNMSSDNLLSSIINFFFKFIESITLRFIMFRLSQKKPSVAPKTELNFLHLPFQSIFKRD